MKSLLKFVPVLFISIIIEYAVDAFGKFVAIENKDLKELLECDKWCKCDLQLEAEFYLNYDRLEMVTASATYSSSKLLKLLPFIDGLDYEHNNVSVLLDPRVKHHITYYEDFIDDMNKDRIEKDPKATELPCWPVHINLLKLFLLDMANGYAVNTLRQMVSTIHTQHKLKGCDSWSSQIFKEIDETYLQCKEIRKCLADKTENEIDKEILLKEGWGKAPVLFLLLMRVLTFYLFGQSPIGAKGINHQ